MSYKFKIAICQMNVKNSKKENIKTAVDMIKSAKNNGSQIAILPEIFNFPYDINLFRENAEFGHQGETLLAMTELAKKINIYILAGSIIEYENDKLYNTSYFIDSKGNIIGKHRKIHLFDIDIPDKITFKESDEVSAGSEITVADTEFGKVGIAICYDIRFPELFRKMAMNGAKLIIVPSTFNMTTGPKHWEMLLRCRSVDNQLYIAGACSARDYSSKYVSYANSMIIDPWGEILANAGESQNIIYAEIDFNKIEEIRNNLPLLKNLRRDIYNV